MTKKPNLFICLTPLQALIAQTLIRQMTAPVHFLMLCYAQADNAKFHHYFQQVADLCERVDYVVLPQSGWRSKFITPRVRKNLQKQYDTVFFASTDNDNIQYILSHIDFERVETFDDGTGNLYSNSILYRNPVFSLNKKIRRCLQGIRYQTEDLRRLSQRHHTLYPEQTNIVVPTVPVNLWQDLDMAFDWQHAGSLPTRTLLLGQPLFEADDDNIALFQSLIAQTQVDAYFPHPRESYHLDGVQYINSHLIFEDYLIQEMCRQPARIQIYHLGSTAAINVCALPNVQVVALRPNLPLFDTETWTRLYAVQQKLGISMKNIEL